MPEEPERIWGLWVSIEGFSMWLATIPEEKRDHLLNWDALAGGHDDIKIDLEVSRM